MPASILDILRQFFWIPPPPLTENNGPNLSGKVCFVTGGYGGCGFELAKLLFQLDATVYIAGRDEQKARDVTQMIEREFPSSKGRLEILILDLSDMSNIKSAAERFMQNEARLDILVNNAGVNSPPEGSKTAQGFDLQLGTNCLGPFLLTTCLLPVMRKAVETAPAGSVRVIWATSVAIEGVPPEGIRFGQDGVPAFGTDKAMNYNMSKAGNLFYGTECARRYGRDGLMSIPVNPGNLKSNITRHFSLMQRAMVRCICYPPKMGAYTYLYAATSTDLGLSNNGTPVIPWGRLGGIRKLDRAVKKEEVGCTGDAEKFWAWSERTIREYR
ncbi:hypothetical protein BCR34DRAFT_473188 [Clohesyomyces aquaticus]|uniref:Short-chain dehydrogenase n=1 Tax=Clohesyomyces aquaticus TaxID=1231657 RepID=A0A1Y2A959_9PLEO|nr:hypothetical protein BCR34DRAFT_473188 [Clohesyomyces aquaticus]